MAEESLKNKTVKGVAWSGIENIAQFGVSFIVSIVLARLLSPDDYGLIGIIAIFTAVCNTLINAGFTTALIQKKEATDDDYNTVFIVNLLLSILLYFVIYACSPFISVFFDREELTILTRVSSISIVVGALSLVPQTILTKKIEFKSQTKIALFSSFLSGILGILMALMGYGVWSLVAQQILLQFLKTIMLLIVNKWVPKIRFSYDSFCGLFDFGWKIMLSSLIDTIWRELYQVVVGKCYSPATLGQYTRANGFSQLLSNNLTTVVQRVTFPVLSSIQDEKPRMVVAYRKIIRSAMFVTAIGMFFLGAISGPFIYCVIGPKWNEAAIYLPLICISGSTYPLQAINLNMLEVEGRGGLYLFLEIIKKIIAIAPLASGIFWGIIPMLYINILINIVCFFFNSHYSGKFIGYSSWMQIKDVLPSYGVALSISLPVYFLIYLPFSYWLILSIQLSVGVLLFFVICSYAKLEDYKEIQGIVKCYLNKNRN